MQTLCRLTPSDTIIAGVSVVILKENGPKWLLYNLAALYWRVAGIQAEAITCLRQALADESPPHHDVAFVQLAQLSVTAGERLDDGIVLMKQALDTHPNEVCLT